MTDLEARILSHRPDAANREAIFSGTLPEMPTDNMAPDWGHLQGSTGSLTMAQLTGGCYHCGKPTEFVDHNSCINCVEQAMADIEGTEAFDS